MRKYGAFEGATKAEELELANFGRIVDVDAMKRRNQNMVDWKPIRPVKKNQNPKKKRKSVGCRLLLIVECTHGTGSTIHGIGNGRVG